MYMYVYFNWYCNDTEFEADHGEEAKGSNQRQPRRTEIATARSDEVGGTYAMTYHLLTYVTTM